MRTSWVITVAIACALPACVLRGGADWVRDLDREPPAPLEPSAGWTGTSDRELAAPAAPVSQGFTGDLGSSSRASAAAITGDRDVEEPPVMIRDHGHARRADRADRGERADRGAPALADGAYRNTYYDFPAEGAGTKDATLYDATCAPIAPVTTAFHDRVCVQGSGRLSEGSTVSFARRGCSCAAVCPRTGQQICFERLDPAQFPSGRGAMGRPITPLRTVAVDSSVIPLGTSIYIPELAGAPRGDGTAHDGCFVAEDRGIKVVGRHVDVFTGDPTMTLRWNALVPSNQGVHVLVNHPRCAPPTRPEPLQNP